jgi:hypothetical protein
MNVDDLNGRSGIITSVQSTFLVLSIDGSQRRVDFRGKVEHRIKKGASGVIQLLDFHPLLIDYNEPGVEIYINSKPENGEALIRQFEQTITAVLSGCRSWLNYVTDGPNFRYVNFERNVAAGNGLLLRAPRSIASAVLDVCRLNNIETKEFESIKRIDRKRLLSVANYYVIAGSFTIRDTHSN